MAMALWGIPKIKNQLKTYNARVSNHDWDPGNHMETFDKLFDELVKALNKGKDISEDLAILTESYLCILRGLWLKSEWEKLSQWIVLKGSKIKKDLGAEYIFEKTALLLLDLLDSLKEKPNTDHSRCIEQTVRNLEKIMSQIPGKDKVKAAASSIFFIYFTVFQNTEAASKVIIFKTLASLYKELGINIEYLLACYVFLSTAFDKGIPISSETIRNLKSDSFSYTDPPLKIINFISSILWLWAEGNKEEIRKSLNEILKLVEESSDLNYKDFNLKADHFSLLLIKLLEGSFKELKLKLIFYLRCLRFLKRAVAYPTILKHFENMAESHQESSDLNIMIFSNLILGKIHLLKDENSTAGEQYILGILPLLFPSPGSIEQGLITQVVDQLSDVTGLNKTAAQLLAVDISLLKNMDDLWALAEYYRIKEKIGLHPLLEKRIALLKGDEIDPSRSFFKMLYHFRKEDFHAILEQFRELFSTEHVMVLMVKGLSNLLASRFMSGIIEKDPIDLKDVDFSFQALSEIVKIPIENFALPRKSIYEYWSQKGTEGVALIAKEKRKDLMDLLIFLFDNAKTLKDNTFLASLGWIIQVGFTGIEWKQMMDRFNEVLREQNKLPTGTRSGLSLVLADINARLGEFATAFFWLAKCEARADEKVFRLKALFNSKISIEEEAKEPEFYQPQASSINDARLKVIMDFVSSGHKIEENILVKCGNVFFNLWKAGFHEFLVKIKSILEKEEYQNWGLDKLQQIKKMYEERHQKESDTAWRPWYFYFAAKAGMYESALDILEGFYKKRLAETVEYQSPDIPGSEKFDHIYVLAYAAAAITLHGTKQDHLVPLLANHAEKDNEFLRQRRKQLLYQLEEKNTSQPSLNARMICCHFVENKEDIDHSFGEIIWRSGSQHAQKISSPLEKLIQQTGDNTIRRHAIWHKVLLELSLGKSLEAWESAKKHIGVNALPDFAENLNQGLLHFEKSGFINIKNKEVLLVVNIFKAICGGEDGLKAFQNIIASDKKNHLKPGIFWPDLSSDQVKNPWIILLFSLTQEKKALNKIWESAKKMLDHRQVALALLTLLENRLPLSETQSDPLINELYAIGLSWRNNVEASKTAISIFSRLIDGLQANTCHTRALLNVGEYLASQGEDKLCASSKRVLGQLMEKAEDKTKVAGFYLDSLKQDPESYAYIEKSLANWPEKDLLSPEITLLRAQISISKKDIEAFLNHSETFVDKIEWWKEEENMKPLTFPRHMHDHLESIIKATPALKVRATFIKGKILLLEGKIQPAITELKNSQELNGTYVDKYLEKLSGIYNETDKISFKKGIIELHFLSSNRSFKEKAIEMLIDLTEVLASSKLEIVIETVKQSLKYFKNYKLDPLQLINCLYTVFISEKNRSNTALANLVADTAAIFGKLNERITHTVAILKDVDGSCQDILIEAAQKMVGKDSLAKPLESIIIGRYLVEINRLTQAWSFLLEPLRKLVLEKPDKKFFEEIYHQLLKLSPQSQKERESWMKILAWLGHGLGNSTQVATSFLTLFNEIYQAYPAEDDIPEVLNLSLQKFPDSWPVNFIFGEIYFYQNNFKKSAPYFERVPTLIEAEEKGKKETVFTPIEENPFHPGTFYSWEKWTDLAGTCFERLERWEEAITVYRDAIERERALHDKTADWAKRQKSLRRLLWTAKKKHVNKLLKKIEGLEEMTAQQASLCHQIAEINQGYGYPYGIDLSVSMLHKALSGTHPGNDRAKILLDMAKCHLDRGGFRAALESLELINEDPMDEKMQVDFHWTMGIVNQELGRFTRASTHLSKALLGIAPSNNGKLYKAIENRLKNVQMQEDLVWESPKYILPQLDLLNILDKEV